MEILGTAQLVFDISYQIYKQFETYGFNVDSAKLLHDRINATRNIILKLQNIKLMSDDKIKESLGMLARHLTKMNNLVISLSSQKAKDRLKNFLKARWYTEDLEEANIQLSHCNQFLNLELQSHSLSIQSNLAVDIAKDKEVAQNDRAQFSKMISDLHNQGELQSHEIQEINESLKAYITKIEELGQKVVQKSSFGENAIFKANSDTKKGNTINAIAGATRPVTDKELEAMREDLERQKNTQLLTEQLKGATIEEGASLTIGDSITSRLFFGSPSESTQQPKEVSSSTSSTSYGSPINTLPLPAKQKAIIEEALKKLHEVYEDEEIKADPTLSDWNNKLDNYIKQKIKLSGNQINEIKRFISKLNDNEEVEEKNVERVIENHP